MLLTHIHWINLFTKKDLNHGKNNDSFVFCFPAVAFAQTYQQLSERAIECIEKDSLPKAEELLLQALKLEPKNAKNALLFSNLGLVQRRLGEFDKALESYSFALNFAPLAVPILLDRAAIYMEMGKQTVLIPIIVRCLMRISRTRKLY